MIEQSEPADLPVSTAEPGDRATVEHSPSSADLAVAEEMARGGMLGQGTVQQRERAAAVIARIRAEERTCQHCGSVRDFQADCDAALQEANQAWMDECKVAERQGAQKVLDRLRTLAVAVHDASHSLTSTEYYEAVMRLQSAVLEPIAALETVS